MRWSRRKQKRKGYSSPPSRTEPGSTLSQGSGSPLRQSELASSSSLASSRERRARVPRCVGSGASLAKNQTETPLLVFNHYACSRRLSRRHTRDMKRAAAATAALALPCALLSGGHVVVAWTAAPPSLRSKPTPLQCRQSRRRGSPANPNSSGRSRRSSTQQWGGASSASFFGRPVGGWVPQQQQQQQQLAWLRQSPCRLCMTSAAGGGVESENNGVWVCGCSAAVQWIVYIYRVCLC